MRPWWVRLATLIANMPLHLRVVLMLAAILHAMGLSWGLPGSDAWDNDGIAPRDVLPGLASTFTPGDFYTYPPLHLALLTILTLPVTIIAIAKAPSASVPAVIKEIIAPSYMTAFSLTARVVALLMSLGIAIAIAQIAEEICEDKERAPRVGTFTAAIVSVGTTLTYYSHTSNLDVPSLFWGSLAALSIVRAVARHEPRRLRGAVVLVACAVATKDQAYALFLVSAPLLLALWLAFDSWGRMNRMQIAREAILAAVLGAILVLLLDGAIFNPSGFRARVAFLRGPASQDFSNYEKGASGQLAIVVEIAKSITRHYPAIFGALILVGVVDAIRNTRRRVVAFAPLAFAISFTVAFNFAARRTDDRFILPQMLFVAIYAGFAMERLWTLPKTNTTTPSLRMVTRTACIALFGMATWETLRIGLTQMYEARYDAEAFLASHVQPNDVVEVHGLNVYLPRFPPQAKVTRVGPPKRRSPLPDVEEIEAPFMDIGSRKPRFVVVSSCFTWRYFVSDKDLADTQQGHVYPTSQQRERGDRDATDFFQGLFAGKLGYHQVHNARIRETSFRPIDIHASLNCKIATFERDGESESTGR